MVFVPAKTGSTPSANVTLQPQRYYIAIDCILHAVNCKNNRERRPGYFSIFSRQMRLANFCKLPYCLRFTPSRLFVHRHTIFFLGSALRLIPFCWVTNFDLWYEDITFDLSFKFKIELTSLTPSCYKPRMLLNHERVISLSTSMIGHLSLITGWKCGARGKICFDGVDSWSRRSRQLVQREPWECVNFSSRAGCSNAYF